MPHHAYKAITTFIGHGKKITVDMSETICSSVHRLKLSSIDKKILFLLLPSDTKIIVGI
jgi:hypothetical protein